MRGNRRWVGLLSACVLALGLAALAAGCGGGSKSSNKSGQGQGTSNTSSKPQQKKFANFRLVYDTGIDYLDPGLSYTVEGWEIMWNVYLSLLGYKHAAGPEGATIVPQLAENLPQVSADGLTYKLKLRKGLTYSDGTPVKASDFRYAIERDFKVDSPGVGFFSNIVGADQFGKTKTGHISGIVVNDATGDITVKLAKPQGDFQNILATIFAAPVPQTTPAKDQSTTPIPSTGPYMIASYKPNKSFLVVRNPKFDATKLPNQPAGNPDKMTGSIIEDPGAALQRVINNQGDYDFQQPPPDRLGIIQAKYADRYKVYTPANTYYFFMNTRVKPFDDVRVRQAVNYAIDRNALTKVYGGLADPTENVLPPTYPQYKKLSMYPHDLAKAKQLIKAAGATGVAVTVWNHDRGTDPKATEYLNDVLNKIGLKSSIKIINSSVYWQTIGNQKTKAQIGFADWFQDYPHPLDWFDVLLNGTRITQTHNNNYSNANVPAINQKIAQLKKEPTLSSSVNDQWAQVDQMVDKNALWAPFLNRKFIDFFSTRMDLGCYQNHVLYQFDYSTICAK